jgi:diguanylate cyclase (GGDEF)-like protein/PAS domain S-box-containing protein
MVWKFPFRDASGEDFVAGIALDVTEHKRAEQVLRESEERFRIMADGCPTMMWVTDADGGNQFINQAYRDFTGTTYQQVAGKKWELLIHPDDAAEYVRAYEQALKEHTRFKAEVRVRRADGQWRCLASDAMPRFSSKDAFLGLVGLSTDITERKRAEQTLQSSEEKFRQLAENIREVFWIMDAAAAEMLYVSPAYEQVFGQDCGDLYANPRSWILAIHPEDRAVAEETFVRQVRGEILENEYRIVRPFGDIRWIRNRAFPVRDADGAIVRLAGIAEDTTERKLAELQLGHQALYDELTDLPNRRLFRERLRQAVAECEAGKVGGVFFIDIDQFKLVNETLGHATGDRLLKEAARRLLAVCRESDTLARFGGDEFILLATGFDGSEPVRHFGERLIACMEEPFGIDDREVFVSTSIGISLFPKNGTDPLVLKTEANVAMHEAKRAGKHQIKFFSAGFADAARERLDLETKLQRALARSEFKLHFQPQFAADRSRPSRFEALIRWYPPDEQPIPPLKFIPLAEQNGLIAPIGSWVLHEACRRCAEWQTGSLKGAGVAVNVSALQFVRPDFVELVARTLESTGLRPELLELELTESVLIQNMATSDLTLKSLRSLGVTIALDDFGTGYSSLSYLQALQIDALKMDRSFLMEAVGGRRGVAVMRWVVEMAHALGLRVVAEGVETTAQLEFLASIGCDEIQGYLLGRPSFEVAGVAGAIKWHTVNRAAVGQFGRLNGGLIVNGDADDLTGRQPEPA